MRRQQRSADKSLWNPIVIPRRWSDATEVKNLELESQPMRFACRYFNGMPGEPLASEMTSDNKNGNGR